MPGNDNFINLTPTTPTTTSGINNLSKVLAKTYFYNAYNVARLNPLYGWMIKDPIIWGEKIRRIAMGMIQIESFEDVKGQEFKEKIPMLPNLIEEEYGHDLKFTASTVVSALQNADKFENASLYAQYKTQLRGQAEAAIERIPHLLLLGIASLFDTAQKAIVSTAPTSTTTKLDLSNPTLVDVFKDTFSKAVKKDGSAKYNDGVTWNDMANIFGDMLKSIKNVYVLDDNSSSDEVLHGASDYDNQLITLLRTIWRAKNQLTSPMPNINNTLDTEDTPSSGTASKQNWPTNCEAGDLVLIMNRTDALEASMIMVPALPTVATMLDVNSFGFGTVVAMDGVPPGCFCLVDKHWMNVHIQYQASFSKIFTDTATEKTVYHYRAKCGNLTKVPGLFFISKESDWKKPAFKKKANS